MEGHGPSDSSWPRSFTRCLRRERGCLPHVSGSSCSNIDVSSQTIGCDPQHCSLNSLSLGYLIYNRGRAVRPPQGDRARGL